MSTMKAILTRGDDDHEIPVTVHYTACKARAGKREGGRGLPLEPDEPAHIEIDGVNRDDSAGEDIDITPRERADLELAIGEHEYELICAREPEERERGALHKWRNNP
jgi:hypothetical protein